MTEYQTHGALVQSLEAEVSRLRAVNAELKGIIEAGIKPNNSLVQAARQALEALEPIHPGNMTPMAEEAWKTAITALREALEQPQKTNQCGEVCERAKLCATCAQGLKPDQASEPVAWIANEWSVFNTGAEVASGLSLNEAMDYLTDERAAREWSVVCVINKDNIPTPAAPQPTRQPLTDEQVWKSEEIMAVNAAVGLVMDDLMMLVRAVERAHGIGGEA